MAEERGASREYPAWRPKPAAWTKLFGTFLVALDPFKLLAAAAGILATALGWWLISLVFYSAWTLPKESEYDTKFTDKPEGAERTALQTGAYQKDLATWAMIHELAGPSDRPNTDYANYYKTKHPTTDLHRDGVVIDNRGGAVLIVRERDFCTVCGGDDESCNVKV